MKRLTCLLCMTSLVLLAACAKKTTVDDVVNKTVMAQGGAAKLDAIQDQVSTWDMSMVMPAPEGDSMMTMETPSVITFKSPNKIKFETMGPDGSVMMATVFDGASGWNSMGGMVVEMTEAEKNENATMAETWVGFFHNYAAKGMQVQMLPDTVMDTKNYHRIKATDRFSNATVNYVNAQTGLVEVTEGAGTDPMDRVKKPYTMYFSDYKEFDGVVMATKVFSRDAAGNVVWEGSLKDVEHNSGVPDEAFAMPEGMPHPAP